MRAAEAGGAARPGVAGRGGAVRVETGRELDAVGGDHAADQPPGGGETVGVGAAVEAEHPRGSGEAYVSRRRARASWTRRR